MPLRFGVWVGYGAILRRTVFLRKAFVAMVNIDGNDGENIFIVLAGLFASKPAPTGFCVVHRLLSPRPTVGAGLLAKAASRTQHKLQTNGQNPPPILNSIVL
ncbi:hypothetical protein BK665_25920 [Pseudomonas frederiksbergensis]|uniref:Uncharacterized protein n=1 Tax=Pseudomonas frederiksbergensis TaxID=104087 RepID=A0A423K7Q9_9PSED|nr:hypothetical protein BK665_25920 [Pseudomonas frederiksbergensis]